MRPELAELSVSGMDVLGTTPCFATKAVNMSHWPPSDKGLRSRKSTVRSLEGRSAVSMIASNIKLARSSLSQNIR